MAGSTTASVEKNKVGGVRANGEDHVASMIADGSIGVSGQVIEKHVASLLSLFGGEAWLLEISLRATMIVGSQQRE